MVPAWWLAVKRLGTGHGVALNREGKVEVILPPTQRVFNATFYTVLGQKKHQRVNAARYRCLRILNSNGEEDVDDDYDNNNKRLISYARRRNNYR